MPASTHEDLTREEAVTGSSNRSFGFIFAGFLLLVALQPLLRHRPVRVWALAASALFAIAALAIPAALTPLNRAWMKFGLLLSKVTNPIITALLFFLVFTPFAVVMRMLGKDLLNLNWNPSAPSYWIPRNPPGPPASGLKNQF